MKIALVVGHSQKDKGAVNQSFGMSEFEFNDRLAKAIVAMYGDKENEIVIVYRTSTYEALPKQINALDVGFVVELHCNAFNKIANGCEMLYYHASAKGKECARIFQNKVVNLLGNKDRGIKSKTIEDRGGYLLKYTKAPAIITEPFFIDNDDEYFTAKALLDSGDLPRVMCEAIDGCVDFLSNGRYGENTGEM